MFYDSEKIRLGWIFWYVYVTTERCRGMKANSSGIYPREEDGLELI